MPSLVAELGSIIEDHLKSISMIHDPEMSPARKALIAEKRHAYEQRSKKNAEVTPSPVSTDEGWGEGALPDNMEDPAAAIAVPGDGATYPPSASLCHQSSTTDRKTTRLTTSHKCATHIPPTA